ncbi:MAM and LDL-receptor class A domain-containing protein 1-like isoform X4 [Stylophora pistillata]|uniref:MAM and LDL-receptor class A domain-containing protein 1-like isoform X4 n=1 Tax=Stylophora pistillata TaxID=50429 RepID=UPI000C044BAA|nr:MAM and LDL-receptor class A domain-containing protein 1-like isoform X4 [Stylophora pistillata]
MMHGFCVLIIMMHIFWDSALPQRRKTVVGKAGNCNFDSESFCKWRPVQGRNFFNWQLQKGTTPSAGTGPKRDHTGNNGHYAYIESSSPRKMGDRARLIHGPFSGVLCLHFSYSMIGSSIGQLNIYHVLHGMELNMWSKDGQQRGADWHSDNATLYGKNFYVIIEAVVGKSYTSDIGIDDIYFTKGSCRGENLAFEVNSTESGGKCSFNMGLCDWANDLTNSDTSPWMLSSYRGRGQSKKDSAVGRLDHGNNLGGKYVYAMKSQGKPSKYRMVSPEVCGTKCVELFYFTNNFQKSELRLLAGKDQGEDRVWFESGLGKKTDDWTRAVVEIKAEETTCFKLVFEARLHQTTSLVGLDDLLIANGTCCPLISTPEDAAKANCDFDQGKFCNWRQSMKSSFSWSIGSGETSSRKSSGGLTGPMADASGNGKYAYIEASEPQMNGDKAVLVSDMIEGQQCMRFKYHMHGEDVGSLSIYRRGFLIWKKAGNHGDQWLNGQVDLDCKIPKYQVEIEATVVGWRGDIAIDELQFTPGGCPRQALTNTARPRATTPTPPDILPLPPPFSTCTFNNNFCDWTNVFDDDGEWHLANSDTPSEGTGPHYDSDGNGYYVHMEASNLLKGQRIRLESQEFFSPVCLHFHYHMYGKDINQLRLEQRNLKDNSTKVVWSITGEQEDYWHFASQNFSGEHYTVSFVGVRGDSYLGDISLDEVSVGELEECHVEISSALKDGGANPKEGNCDFEDGSCKWINMKDDKFDWTSHSGRTPSSQTGPSRDHTPGKKGDGKYMYIETSSPRKKGDKAMLLVKLDGRSFCMSFWYHMHGSAIGSLEIMRIVKQVKDDQKPSAKDFNLREHREWIANRKNTVPKDHWRQANVDLEVRRSVRQGTVHWIAIVGTVGSSYTGDIAVDDIQFSEGRCSQGKQ